jgi:alginate O-acetyltransferase complex protein AlgI
MVFHSPNFLIFMILLLIPYYLWQKGRIRLLIVASCVFYAASGIGLLLLFIAMTGITFIAMRLMQRPALSWMFWVGIAANVGNLVYFKYSLMFLNTIELALGRDILLTDLARTWLTDGQGELLLPVGISFYTFQFISYLIDVRRGTVEGTRNPFRLWMYVSVFPHLMAGPIMRGGELIPQLDKLNENNIRWNEIRFGLYMILVGLIKKVALADQIAPIVNTLYGDIDSLSTAQAWLATYLFGFQIYFDFSAYSDMALGLGYLLGFQLIINFRTPYLSSNPSEFWNRWHISLSRWIRDYIYIGLGGNRKGSTRTYVNLLAAMLISGLWHGAAWHFAVWGGVHGLLLVVYRWWTKVMDKLPWTKILRANSLYHVLSIFVFYHIVTWTWVFFRAKNLGEAWTLTLKMAGIGSGAADTPALSAGVSFANLADVSPLLRMLRSFADAIGLPTSLSLSGGLGAGLLLVAVLYALHIFEWALRDREAKASRVWHWVPAPLRGFVYAAIILALFYFMKGETYDFIYFQF